MAGTVTDLDGFFRNDEDNLSKQLTSFFGGLKPKEYPSKIAIQVKIAGSASFESLLKDERGTAKSIVVAEKPTDIGLIIAEIEGGLTTRYGPNPTGFHLRIRASKNGQAASPDVDMTRKIVAGESSDIEGSASLWKEMYERKCVEYTELQRFYLELVKSASVMFNSSTVLNAEQGKTIGALGTARTAATAANDYGGLTTIIGMFAMFWLLPQIKATLGLSPSASLVQVGKSVEKLLTNGEAPPGQTDAPRRPPAAAMAPKELEGPTETTTAPEPEGEAVTVDAVIKKSTEDEAFFNELKERIKGNPDLLMKVLS